MRIPLPRIPLPKLPTTMRARYMLAFASTITVAMVATILLVNERMGRLLLEATRDKSTAIAQSLGATTANALLNYDYVSLAQAADNAVDQSGIDYVVILDKEGRVAAQSGRGVLGGEEIPELPWSDLSEQPATWTRTLSVGGGDRTRHILDVAHPVYVEGSDVRWGVVRLGLDLDPMRRAILRVRLLLAAIGVVALVLALAAARFVSDRIGRSLGGLVEGTLEIARGNLDHRIAPRSDDEIATVARHFNYMAAQVRRQQTELAIAKSELEALNATLEEKVLRRTQELVASEEKYRVLVDQSPDPILIVQGGAVRFVNPAFERLVGYRVPNHEDLRAEVLFPADERGRATGFLDEVFREGTSTGGEFRVVTRAGAERTFEMRGMRITYLAAPAVALAMHDTTERKELQESLVRHEKLRALGELASGVAHDFNNILGIILGRSQLLQRRATDTEVRRGLQTIERAAFDGGETVRRIQDFARARTERNFSDVDLNTLLTEVVEITRTRWRDQAEVRNVRIEMKLVLGRLANVLGHPSELREIFTNLIFNAVDAMPGGGRIEIRSRTEEGHAVVEVADSGCGIPESTRSRIFDPFFST
ncbi:MAG: PAS domain S-box protein, partial [Gemmatimonadetes bacterium]|nr:PAS domain S-box protein [Gemmatimonadota bacterium]